MSAWIGAARSFAFLLQRGSGFFHRLLGEALDPAPRAFRLVQGTPKIVHLQVL